MKLGLALLLVGVGLSACGRFVLLSTDLPGGAGGGAGAGSDGGGSGGLAGQSGNNQGGKNGGAAGRGGSAGGGGAGGQSHAGSGGQGGAGQGGVGDEGGVGGVGMAGAAGVVAGGAGGAGSTHTVQVPDLRDASVYFSHAPNTQDHNFGQEDFLLSSAWNTADPPAPVVGGAIRVVFYIEFDLSGVPASASVEQAELSLFASPAVGVDPKYAGHVALSGTNDFWLESVVDSWDESTVTWLNQPLAAQHGPTSVSDDLGQHYPGTEVFNQDLVLDVTPLVRTALSDRAKYHGFRVHLSHDEEYRQLRFFSKEAAEVHRPRLAVRYSAP